MSRYDSSKKATNDNEFYGEFFEERNVKSIEQFRTRSFPVLTSAVRRRFTSARHIWKMGDSYWKIASEYYGNPRLWWVLAWYNEKPTESHVKVGGILLIPTPVEEVISFFHSGV